MKLSNTTDTAEVIPVGKYTRLHEGPKVIKSPYKREARRSQGRCGEGNKSESQRGLQMEEGDTSQRMQAASRSWRKGTDSALEPSEDAAQPTDPCN